MSEQHYTPDVIERAEQLVSRIQGISSCRISTDETGLIGEVHVAATARKSPKLVARDVEAVLNAELGMEVDHRKISVVVYDQPPTTQEPAPEAAPSQSDGAPAAVPADAIPAEQTLAHFPIEELAARFIFQSVNLFQSQENVQAEVELTRNGLECFGSATSIKFGQSHLNVVAEATLNAIGELLDDTIRLCLSGVVETPIGDDVAIIVKVDLLQERDSKSLVGCSLYSGNTNQSVVFATLDAVNRAVGKLDVKSSVEYKIR
jgi:hypothetical protein